MSYTGYLTAIQRTQIVLNNVTTSGTPVTSPNFNIGGSTLLHFEATYTGAAGTLTFTFTTDNSLASGPFKCGVTDLAAGTIKPVSIAWTAGTSDSINFAVPIIARNLVISVTGPAGSLTLYGSVDI